MKHSVQYGCLLALLLSSLGWAQQPSKTASAKRETPRNITSNAGPEPIKPVTVPDAQPAARVVQYGERDVVPVKTKLRYTTLIILPKEEEILDFTCGDKEFWVINGNQNFAYIKPAKLGARTNLNLVTASGNVYSFALAEVSDPDAQADLKVFVEWRGASSPETVNSPPRFVSTQRLDEYRRQVELAKEETRQVKESTQAAIDRGVSRFITNVRFPYRFDAGKKPFLVRAMYHDDKFTYIQARPEETPTLYEVKDAKPNLVNFTYKDGVYVADKIIDRGYLMIGKQKLTFARED